MSSIHSSLFPILDEPIKLKLGEKGSRAILICGSTTQDLSQESGCLFGGQHFGFCINVTHDGQSSEIKIPTQCPIVALEKDIKRNIIRVWEQHKYVPWYINLQGKVVKVSKFLSFYEEDANFVMQNLSWFDPEKQLSQDSNETYNKFCERVIDFVNDKNISEFNKLKYSTINKSAGKDKPDKANKKIK